MCWHTNLYQKLSFKLFLKSLDFIKICDKTETMREQVKGKLFNSQVSL